MEHTGNNFSSFTSHLQGHTFSDKPVSPATYSSRREWRASSNELLYPTVIQSKNFWQETKVLLLLRLSLPLETRGKNAHARFQNAVPQGYGTVPFLHVKGQHPPGYKVNATQKHWPQPSGITTTAEVISEGRNEKRHLKQVVCMFRNLFQSVPY